MVNDLIFHSPEQEGISSKDIMEFLDFIEGKRINLHSFMMIRNGNIVAEGYYKPFNKEFMHRLYSSSKTFVSMAVGLLASEGKIKLNDPIIKYFPEYDNENVDKYTKECTIEDALKMSVGIAYDSYWGVENWAESFFSRYDSRKVPGTIFHYNTSGTFILDVLIEKVTGKTFMEYLRPVFDEIGISKDAWCVKSPDGYAWGGSGVVMTIRDFAKFAELLMNKGEYKGKQLLPRDYVIKATSSQINNLYCNTFDDLKTRGYGYQVWITKNGFAFRGMGCQIALCFPSKNFMVVTNGDTQCAYGDVADSVVYYAAEKIFNNIADNSLPESNDYKILQNRLANLKLLTNYGDFDSEFKNKINGVKYNIEKSVTGWKWFKIDFEGDEGVITYENTRGIKSFRFGFGKYVQGTFPETHYYDTQVGKPANRELNAMFSANWVEKEKLLIRAYITDTNFGNCFMQFGFKDDKVGMLFEKTAEMFLDDYVGFSIGIKE